jgi:hypothetical protein
MITPDVQVVVPAHNLEIFGIRLPVADAQNGRKLLVTAKLEEAKIGVVSGTYEIVGLPPIQVRVDSENTLHRK